MLSKTIYTIKYALSILGLFLLHSLLGYISIYVFPLKLAIDFNLNPLPTIKAVVMIINLPFFILLFALFYTKARQEKPYYCCDLIILLMTAPISLLYWPNLFGLSLFVACYALPHLWFACYPPNRPLAVDFDRISVKNFLFLSLLTLGLYRWIWWYRNWRYLKTQNNDQILPVLRAFFPIFFYRQFLNKLNSLCEEKGVARIKNINEWCGFYLYGLIIYLVVATFIGKWYLHAHPIVSMPLYSVVISISYLIIMSVVLLPPIAAINRLVPAKPIVSSRHNLFFLAFILLLSVFKWGILLEDIGLAIQSKETSMYTSYYHGQYEKAYIYAERLSKEGNPRAQEVLGELYLEGLGVPQDTYKAVDWLKKSANQSNAEAQNLLAKIFRDEKNYKESVYWYQRAVENGHKDAPNDLAICYEKGWGVAKDLHTAHTLFSLGAERGDDIAMYNLGLDAAREKHYRAAAEWYQKALKSPGNFCAAHDLGNLYAKGLGVQADRNKASTLFTQSAKLLLRREGKLMQQTDLRHETYAQLYDNVVKSFVNRELNHQYQTKTDAERIAADMAQKIKEICWD